MSAAGLYGGDEVGGIVIDVGSSSVRIGYAGEDAPKGDVCSYMGVYEEAVVEKMEETGQGEGAAPATKKKYLLDTPALHAPKEGCELGTFIKDGMIEDWALFEKMLDYLYGKYVQSSSEHHPVVMSEPAWNTKAKREKMTELLFEKYNVPAMYLVKSPVLSCFASGRATGLVLDSGATLTSAVPVYDGQAIVNAIVKTPLAGDFVSAETRKMVEAKGIEVVPSYMIASKDVINPPKDNEPARWTKKQNLPRVGTSWHNFMVKEVMQDVQQSVLQVAENPYDEAECGLMPQVHYEFPNGFHTDFGVERFRVAEPLFSPASMQFQGQPPLSIGHVVSMCANMCDMDLRPVLYQSVVVTGGNTLLSGFVERLQKDLHARTPPSMRCKLMSSQSAMERRFGPWVGCSILASLGTFQQMWISKQEFGEKGKECERRCP